MDLGRYLRRIGAQRPEAPDAAALRELHEAHLLAVPFENLSIAWREPIVLEEPALYRKIVERGRGGCCHELNGLFAWALRELGYAVDLLSARVRRDRGDFGPEYDHMCLRVLASGRAWLADVGFGDSFRQPMALDESATHAEGRSAWRLAGVGEELELSRRDGDGPWTPQFRLALSPRRLREFVPMSEYHQTSPDAPFTRRRVCTRATAWGRLTLNDVAVVSTTLDGDRTEEPVPGEEAWAEALRACFGIDRSAPGDRIERGGAESSS